MSLVQALFLVALIGYCLYFALSLRRLRRRLADMQSRDASRVRRRWAIRSGLLMPLVFLPMYVDNVVDAVWQFGWRRVALPAAGIALLMLAGGLLTGLYVNFTERRSSTSAHNPHDSYQA